MVLIRMRADVLVAADLPPELLGHIVGHATLDAASRLALFRSSHALARLVLVHAPGSKQLTHLVTGDGSSSGSERWSPTLTDLIGSRWQPLPSALGLELRITSSDDDAAPKPPLPSRLPPTTVLQHTTHLHLDDCLLTAEGLAAWQLHSPALWPHLQHLTVSGHVAHPPTAESLSQLQPIPGLQALSFRGYVTERTLAVVVPLAGNAQRLRLAGGGCDAAERVLARLPHVTHAEVETARGGAINALLRHPNLRHVTVDSIQSVIKDSSKLPCRWGALTVLEGLNLNDLALLPRAQLERLTVHGSLTAHYDSSGAGVAALQRLHAEGGLALRPDGGDGMWERYWRLPPGKRLFRIWTAGGNTAAVVRLVVEAGQGPDGITCLAVGNSPLSIPTIHDEVAPLLRRSGRITTLCANVWAGTDAEWSADLLGALPPCIRSVRVDVGYGAEQQLRALVQGGVASLKHPLTLTLLHGGALTAECEAELRQVVAGGRGAGQQPFLTLEVVERG